MWCFPPAMHLCEPLAHSQRTAHTQSAGMQKLAEDDGTTFYDSAWADTTALKSHFSGVARVRLL